MSTCCFLCCTKCVLSTSILRKLLVTFQISHLLMSTFKMVLTCVQSFTEFKAFESAAHALYSKFLLGFVTGETARTL